jgi:hypothetical protein
VYDILNIIEKKYGIDSNDTDNNFKVVWYIGSPNYKQDVLKYVASPVRADGYIISMMRELLNKAKENKA